MQSMKLLAMIMMSILPISTSVLSDDASTFSPNPTAVSADAPPPIAAIQMRGGEGCLVDAVEDMKRTKLELDSKGKELASRETELKAKEKALEEELKKLENLRDEIAMLESLSKKNQEEKVSKLVETFETMSPKAAAQVRSGPVEHRREAGRGHHVEDLDPEAREIDERDGALALLAVDRSFGWSGPGQEASVD
jgi:hypothetical protein